MKCGNSEGRGHFFFLGATESEKLTRMEELTFELSLERGGDLGSTEKGNGRWTFQAEPTRRAKAQGREILNPRAGNLQMMLSG